MAFIAFLIVVLSVESGRIGALVHMKFGPPEMPPTVMFATVALLAAVPYLQFKLLGMLLPAKPSFSLLPVFVPPQFAKPLEQVQFVLVAVLQMVLVPASGR
jgi:hypothetical protein